MKLQINITKEVLRRSHMCDGETDMIAENCAIAIAVRDLFPNAHVRLSLIRFRERKHHGNIATLPNIAQEFILNFDTSTPQERLLMQPISFEIDVPDKVIDSIGIEQVKQVLSDHPFMQEVEL